MNSTSKRSSSFLPSQISARDWDSHPPFRHPPYASSLLRAPLQPLVAPPGALIDLRAPVYSADWLGPLDHDLTRNASRNGAPLGERIIVTGRVLDDAGHPVPHTLLEVWQANAAGRYVHKIDQHDAPLDPNFLGAGRTLTDAQGRYRLLTIKPGAYPWGNHPNAWRPQHIHFSLFGAHFTSRLITQMYFPGDPLLALDPIYNSTPGHARERLVARFSMDVTEEGFALGYVFDIVLRGVHATPMEHAT
jgi:protocatechuate 3,4-dioxygenase beta subunit